MNWKFLLAQLPATEIVPGTKKYSVDTSVMADKAMGRKVILQDIPNLNVFDKVSVTVKVTEIDAVIETKKKQDIVVKDETGTATVTLWEDN